jgi:hypothetical protein
MNVRDLTFSNFDFVAPYYTIKHLKVTCAARISIFSTQTSIRNDTSDKQLFCYGFTWSEYFGACNAIEVMNRRNA